MIVDRQLKERPKVLLIQELQENKERRKQLTERFVSKPGRRLTYAPINIDQC